MLELFVVDLAHTLKRSLGVMRSKFFTLQWRKQASNDTTTFSFSQYVYRINFKKKCDSLKGKHQQVKGLYDDPKPGTILKQDEGQMYFQVSGHAQAELEGGRWV